jgi:hypothetical protein
MKCTYKNYNAERETRRRVWLNRRARWCTIRSRDSTHTLPLIQKLYALYMNEEGSSQRRRRRNPDRDVWSKRHPKQQAYRSSGRFRPSRPQNKNTVGARLHTWGKKLHLVFVGEGGGGKKVYELLTQFV